MKITFTQKVLEIVRQIPAGKTMSYAQVSQMAGKPNAARAVGTIMSKNFDPAIPCHRVIRSDGKIGNYNRGGIQKKKQILQEEKAI